MLRAIKCCAIDAPSRGELCAGLVVPLQPPPPSMTAGTAIVADARGLSGAHRSCAARGGPRSGAIRSSSVVISDGVSSLPLQLLLMLAIAPPPPPTQGGPPRGHGNGDEPLALAPGMVRHVGCARLAAGASCIIGGREEELRRSAPPVLEPLPAAEPRAEPPAVDAPTGGRGPEEEETVATTAGNGSTVRGCGGCWLLLLLTPRACRNRDTIVRRGGVLVVGASVRDAKSAPTFSKET